MDDRINLPKDKLIIKIKGKESKKEGKKHGKNK